MAPRALSSRLVSAVASAEVRKGAEQAERMSVSYNDDVLDIFIDKRKAYRLLG